MKKCAATFFLVLGPFLPNCYPQSGKPEPVKDSLVLSLTDLGWALEIQAKGFEINKRQVVPDRRMAMLMASNEKTGVIISAFLEKAPGKGGPKECREHYWNLGKKNPFEKKNVRTSEKADKALVEYDIELADFGATQKNVHAYLVQADMWIDIHLSKIPFKAGDDRLFEEVLESVRILEKYSPGVSEYMAAGSYYYLQRNYRKAIENYTKALDLEKKSPKLSTTHRRVLVDNLGMAHGISGDLARARETFEYGLTKDPAYPMFYYNLACTHAEGNDLDKAIENLRQVLKHKGNMIPGEKLPNPAKDSSFKKYLDTEKFKAVLKEFETK
jgi:tetratricopeptide (TPR) repeat protein